METAFPTHAAASARATAPAVPAPGEMALLQTRASSSATGRSETASGALMVVDDVMQGRGCLTPERSASRLPGAHPKSARSHLQSKSPLLPKDRLAGDSVALSMRNLWRGDAT